MTAAPKVSVIIPTYRHRDYVLASLASVFAQSFSDHEIVVVDDGSPDDTVELLRPLAEAGRIVLVRQENQGQAAARNRGLAAARGEYVAYLDDDDLWPPDRLAWQVELLDQQPETVLVYGPCLKLLNGRTAPGPDGPHPSGWVRDALLRQYCLTSPGQATIRTAALRRIGGFDVTLWGVDDWDLYLRLARDGQFQFVDRTALLYRVHEANASHDAVRHARNAWKAYRKHAGRNIPLTLSLARAGGVYFAPRLLEFAAGSRERRRYRAALAGYAFAFAFQPSVLLHREHLKGIAAALLRRPPRGSSPP